MNLRDPDEDLFESSRMSFGEHLEELRMRLIRALLGVAIMCVFGFLLAEHVVQILTSPLEKAQIQYEREEAERRLKAEFNYVPPEYAPLLKTGYIPKPVWIDPTQLADAIQSIAPSFASEVKLDPYGFRPQHILDGQLQSLCKRLSDHDKVDSPTKEKLDAVWQQLTSEEQSQLLQIANSPSLDENELQAARQQVLSILNRLSKLESLYQEPPFAKDVTPIEESWMSYFNPPAPKPLADLRTTLEAVETPQLDRPQILRRLNRALLTSLFPQQMKPLELDVYPLEIWELVDYRPQALGVGESFFVWLKAGLFTGLTLAGPWVFYQLWSFVAAGLYPHEKRYIHWFLPISIALFVGGALLAFFFVFEPVLAFLFSFNRSLGIAPEMRIGEWLGFAMFLPLGFGVAFQLPLVMLFANRIGLITIQTYLEKWRIAVMVIFVLAMFLTPADPISLLLLAVPLTLLYFLGIGMCKWMPKNENPFGDEISPA